MTDIEYAEYLEESNNIDAGTFDSKKSKICFGAIVGILLVVIISYSIYETLNK